MSRHHRTYWLHAVPIYLAPDLDVQAVLGGYFLSGAVCADLGSGIYMR